ncbi:anhydro-N-acetylmuramic acid kinase [Aliagarivorans taiwanensis]|uniref:anhydro-N-acetylmuramic acid kinase n=1 Tax=Aliagarivorans taiwanensis TaxID=561966 RepID=UPI0004208DF2|nr:anhydro-N-acetylmuramic acid kinase [Aliagarivorans taiwanensis]
MEHYIGLMSGTSMDGVDAVLVAIDAQHCQLLQQRAHPMPPSLKADLLAVNQGQPTSLKAIGELDHRLGLLFAEAVNALLDESAIAAKDVRAIGSHGQTVFHQPTGEYPFTLQLGDANLIAAHTGVATVADFRRLDMAFGGQGAPLVPAFHQQMFPVSSSTRVIVNLGGIANITVLQADGSCIGYDTGPANMLLDAWIAEQRGLRFDRDGAWAAQGQALPELLAKMLAEPYFKQPAPKSTGRELFNLSWLASLIGDAHHAPEDVQATLLELTVTSLAEQLRMHGQGEQPELVVCGGGAQNAYLQQQLGQALPDWQLRSSADYGIDPDNLEAIAFAWLAYRRIHNLPSNLPAVTGASRTVSLGAIYPAP